MSQPINSIERAYFAQDFVCWFLNIFRFWEIIVLFYAAQLEYFFVLMCSVYLDVNFCGVLSFGHIPTFCVCFLLDTLMTSIFLQTLGASVYCIKMHICFTKLFFILCFSSLYYIVSFLRILGASQFCIENA